MEGKFTIRADPAIIQNKKVLTIRKSGFPTLPGGIVQPGETLEQACKNRAKENNFNIKIIKPLNPMLVKTKNLQGETITLISINYLAEFAN